jgi:hypothetical protein
VKVPLPALAKSDERRGDQSLAPSPANARREELAFRRSRDRPTKKPKPKERKVAIRARVKPSVKAMAERLAQDNARSMADWLERLIAKERARCAARRKG